MKKVLIILIIFSILLCGCTRPGNSSDNVDHVTVPETSEPIVTESLEPDTEETVSDHKEPVYSQQPMVAVSLPTTTQYTMVDDTPVYSYTYQNIFLSVQDQQVADDVIVDFLNRADRNHAVSQDLADHACDLYNGEEDWVPYFFESIYSPTRIDLNVLSLFGHNVIFTGGNHPQQECMAANYNMVTGEVLTLGSILCNEESIKPLRDLVEKTAAEQKEDLRLFDEYADIISQRFMREASYDEDWYFSENGLCFFFAPYEIAPYTSGIIHIEVAYSDLVGIIDDAFFPAEEDFSEGSVYASKLDDTDIDSYTQITEVILHEDGELILLRCDGLVRNLRVDLGTWSDDGTVYTAEATVLASATLSPGDGIMIQAQIPDVLPTHRLSYRTANQEVVQFISQSGKDGSIILMDF